MSEAGALTPKEAMFVREYLVDLNGTQAAIRAGYAPKSAKVTASRLLTKANIRAAIDEAKQIRVQRIEISQDRILQELGKIGFSDNRRLYDANGRIRPIHELDDETAGAISAIEVVSRPLRGGKKGETEQVAKVKFYDKRAALVDLGRHFGMFREQVDVSVSLEAWVMHSLAPASQPAIDAKQITKE